MDETLTECIETVAIETNYARFCYDETSNEAAIPGDICIEINTERTIADNKIAIPDNNRKSDIINAR